MPHKHPETGNMEEGQDSCRYDDSIAWKSPSSLVPASPHAGGSSDVQGGGLEGSIQQIRDSKIDISSASL